MKELLEQMTESFDTSEPEYTSASFDHGAGEQVIDAIQNMAEFFGEKIIILKDPSFEEETEYSQVFVVRKLPTLDEFKDMIDGSSQFGGEWLTMIEEEGSVTGFGVFRGLSLDELLQRTLDKPVRTV